MRQTLVQLPICSCISLAILSVSFPQALRSQEQLGMRLERYAGIYGAGINPAATAYSPHNWEVSLFNADLFVENSYAFLRNTSLQNALRHTDKIVSTADSSAENAPRRDVIFQEFSEGRRKMHLVTQARLAGPAFSFRFGGNNVVGMTTAIRTHVSSYRVPEILAYQTISDVPRNQAVNISATGIAGMVWGEIGLHYSRVEELGDVQMAWGVSPKYLLGYEGFFTRAQSNFDYTQRLGDTVAFGSANWDYALTTANLTDDPGGIKLRQQGAGFGLDLGVSWVSSLPGSDDESDYAWRAGASLIDLGFLRFKNSAERHHIEFDTLLTISGADFPQRDDAQAILGDVSRAFLGDSAASLQKRSFGMSMPTALSAQFDLRIAPMIYVAGVLVQQLAFSKTSVRRPSTLAVVPRFEHRWLSVSVPFVLNDWRDFRAGAAIRLAWLYVGTDNLGSFFKKEKLSGADVYIGLKINAFSLNFKKGDRGSRTNRARGFGPNRKKIKCYKF